MTDLEERFLKKNIPGKYSTWSEYNEDSDDKERESDREENCDQNGLNIREEEHRISKLSIDGGKGPNTGVKGVLNDRRKAKAFQSLKMAQDECDRQEAFRRATEGSVLKPGEQSISIASIQQRSIEKIQNASDSDSDSDLFDEYDDEFLLSYREKRLSEMKQMRSYPTFGDVTEVNSAIKFSELIDESDSSVYCVFHLYNDSVPCCRLMSEHLEQIARNLDYCRFFRLEVSKVKKNFDPIGFPCILVYRAGQEIANMTPITKQFDSSNKVGGRFTVEDVEAVLATCGVRNPAER